ncbi:hypothetical protein [Aestuariivirga sp.]|uniref:winged helix domain-containing protein n=1 Tax=Aestuariivirga sp. TaxID=2650926 RepID=UPI0039E6C0F5
MAARLTVTGRRLADGGTFTATGRDAWALLELLRMGERGCTPIDNPGPRWSHYVFKLKRAHGLDIETIDEKHGGAFAGTHARYVLRSQVEVLETSDVKEAA